jgi:hypothetical protein
MEKTWKPPTAGILSIVAGALGLIGGLVVGVIGGTFAGIEGIPGVGAMLAAIAIPLIIIGIVAIVGGYYALKRRIWGLALAGTICALFCVWFLGIPAIIFVILGKSEFS